jgi:hypothetical protein
MVEALKASIETTSGFDLTRLSWSYTKNASSGGIPPSIEAVEAWLEKPMYVPIIDLGIKDFEKRASAPISNLLVEYGSFDPDWEPDMKANA